MKLEPCVFKEVERSPPSRLGLRDGALAVYRHLSKEQRVDIDHVKQIIITAFTTDSFVAFENFMIRRLLSGEIVNMFLAELRRLALLVAETPEKWITCAFVAGLLSRVRSLRIDGMNLGQVKPKHRPLCQTRKNQSQRLYNRLSLAPTNSRRVRWPVVALRATNTLD